MSPLVSILNNPTLPCCSFPSNPLFLTLVSFCPGVSTVHPPSPAALPSNHLEATSSHYLNPAQPHSPLRDSTELGRILEPGYLGSGSQWDVMRPQKGSVSGDLSSGSSVCQLNSKPTGKTRSRTGQPMKRNLTESLPLSYLGRGIFHLSSPGLTEWG